MSASLSVPPRAEPGEAVPVQIHAPELAGQILTIRCGRATSKAGVDPDGNAIASIPAPAGPGLWSVTAELPRGLGQIAEARLAVGVDPDDIPDPVEPAGEVEGAIPPEPPESPEIVTPPGPGE